MTTLTFNDVKLNPISQADNQIWLGATQLGLALGYSNPKTAITKIFNRNADEFNESMTKLAELKTNGGLQKVRIFSLRGCHLIAMFAKTQIAKLFRVWVLDILDKEVGQPTVKPANEKTTTDERTPLRQAVTALVGKAKIMHDEAYSMVNQYMGVNHIWEIPKEDLPRAVAYVHSMILLSGNTTPAPSQNEHTDDIKHLITQAFITRSWINAVKEPLRMLNPHLVSGIDGMSAWNSEIARILNKRMNLGVDTKLLEKSWGNQFLPAC